MSWTFVVLALVLFLFAIYIGFLCGQWACEKRVITKRDYWIANFAGAAAVVLLTWVFRCSRWCSLRRSAGSAALSPALR